MANIPKKILGSHTANNGEKEDFSAIVPKILSKKTKAKAMAIPIAKLVPIPPLPYGILFSLGRSASDAVTEAQLQQANSRLVYWDYDSSMGFNFIQSAGTLSTNVYQYLGFTKNSTNGTFYIDGYSSGTGTAALNASISTNDFTIGADIRDSISYVNGNISQFLIYNRVLTAAEVLQNYNTTKGRFGL